MAILLGGALLLWGCQPQIEPVSKDLQQITMAISPTPYSGLVAIADEMGYFRKEGLDARMVLFPSGYDALESLLLGEADLATVADIAVSAAIYDTSQIRVLASIGTNLGSQIVARKDRGIRAPSDLRGKTIGFSANTTSDYFLYAFLLTEGISRADVTVVNVPPDRQVEALLNGEVDAVSAFAVYAYEAKKALGDAAVSWDSQNNLVFHWLLVTRADRLGKPAGLEKTLRALLRAESFAHAQPDAAQRIIARKWGYDPAFMRVSWPRNRLDVSLSQSIVASLRFYSNWYVEKHGQPYGAVDVLDYIHIDVLEKVDPTLVTVFR